MTGLGLLKSCVIATAALAVWLRSRNLLAAGAAEIVAANLQNVLDEIVKADAARDSVRGAYKRFPERLREHDGFERRD